MLRQRMMEKEMQPEQFITRVSELPMVTTAIVQLSAVYSNVKQSNSLLRYTLQTAETGVQAVFSRTFPHMAAQFEKPIDSLNAMACHRLDKLEHDYPIITKSSGEVYSETKEKCSSAVKPFFDTVDSVKQYGINQEKVAMSYTTEKIDDAKAYGVNKFNSASEVGWKQVARVLQSPLGKEVIKNVNSVLGVADNLVNQWLPEEKKAGDSEGIISAEETLCDPGMVLGRAASIGNKVRRRMRARFASRLTNLQLRTKETVERLNFTVDLIEYSRNSMACVKDKACNTWAEINKTDEDVAKELTESAELSARAKVFTDSTFERRAIATARHLTQKLKKMYTNVDFSSEKLPMILQAQLERARDLAHYLASSIPTDLTVEQRLPKFVIDNIRNYTSLLVQATSWMSDWARQVPVFGQNVPSSATNEKIPMETIAQDEQNRHYPSAVKEPAEEKEEKYY